MMMAPGFIGTMTAIKQSLISQIKQLTISNGGNQYEN